MPSNATLKGANLPPGRLEPHVSRVHSTVVARGASFLRVNSLVGTPCRVWVGPPLPYITYDYAINQSEKPAMQDLPLAAKDAKLAMRGCSVSLRSIDK